MNRIRLAAAALSAAALAACADSPSAPVAPAPSAAIAQYPTRTQYWLTMSVVENSTGSLLSQTTAQIDWAVNGINYSKTVVDNGSGDADARVGYYKISVPKAASYKSKLLDMPVPYSSYGTIRETAWSGTSVTNVGQIRAVTYPRVHLLFVDPALKTLGGAAITVTDPFGNTKVVNDAKTQAEWSATGDAYAWAGEILHLLPASGTYKICETTLPPGYLLVVPSCFTLDAKWDGYTKWYMHHELVFSDI